MAGFTFRFLIGGGKPDVQRLTFKDTETITKGDLVNLESGEVDLAATADTNLLGAAEETVAGTDSTSKIDVITNPDAVYAVVDNNARVKGATLDLTGSTGAQGVTTSSNKEFVVHADSAADQPTLVRINIGKHHASKAQ